ncbi:tyrosine-type recombinase/integrase [Priestia flexa]|uniref:tyrosine-type recombinase/integrase n=1 Tax=Priestia flexa TaxID=86664 RepID=UPI000473D313|nr:site-specific integrase [Priestia flexa]
MTNVVRMESKVEKINNEITEVYGFTQKFFDKLSPKTKKTYKSSINNFFGFSRSKQIGELTHSDLQVTIHDFDEYIHYTLYNSELSAATINKNLTGVRSFLTFLHSRGIVKDISYLPAVNNLPFSSKGYSSMTDEEVYRLMDMCKNEVRFSLEKELLIKTAYDTCLRKSEVLNLEWDDFFEFDSEYMAFDGVGKGNKVFKRKITKKSYEKLLEIKKENHKKVFNIPDTELTKSMKRMISALDGGKQRRLVFHSIRKAGAKYHYRNTNHDISFVQRLLGHSNPMTTMKYIEVDDYAALGAMSSKEVEGTEMDLIKDCSHELLLQAIENIDNTSKLLILKEIKKLGKITFD